MKVSSVLDHKSSVPAKNLERIYWFFDNYVKCEKLTETLQGHITNPEILKTEIQENSPRF